MNFQGQCFCGAIDFSIAETPLFMGNCHCRDCQKWTGCAYVPVMVFSRQTFKLNGNPQYTSITAESGNTLKRGFCGNCGGSVHNESSGAKNQVFIYAGVLENPEYYAPKMDFYTKSAQSWNCMLDNTIKAPGSPKTAQTSVKKVV